MPKEIELDKDTLSWVAGYIYQHAGVWHQRKLDFVKKYGEHGAGRVPELAREILREVSKELQAMADELPDGE